MLFQLPPKQKMLLVAICKAGKATAITSADFIRRWHLPSTSSVQSAIKGLVEKSFVTSALGVYEVYDKFCNVAIKAIVLIHHSQSSSSPS